MMGTAGPAVFRPSVGQPPPLARPRRRLEAGLEVLQDATYRQDVMHDAKIAELRHNQRRM